MCRFFGLRCRRSLTAGVGVGSLARRPLVFFAAICFLIPPTPMVRSSRIRWNGVDAMTAFGYTPSSGARVPEALVAPRRSALAHRPVAGRVRRPRSGGSARSRSRYRTATLGISLHRTDAHSEAGRRHRADGSSPWRARAAWRPVGAGLASRDGGSSRTGSAASGGRRQASFCRWTASSSSRPLATM